MGRTVRILTVVGARPQFVKAAAVSAACLETAGDRVPVEETLLHTGQHYDPEMSEVFFEELGIPRPAVNLEVGSGTHGKTTADMLVGIEAELIERRPDWVLLYGDTNSTLAGALAASKLHIPIAHVEAGLRSFKRTMPEEVNRVLTDHLSAALFCPTRTAVQNLEAEGITRGVELVGDVMADCARVFGELARSRSQILTRLELEPGTYSLSTVHRAENTDDPERLRGIFEGLGRLAREHPVVLPLHPRTKARVEAQGIQEMLEPLTIIEPVGFLDMIRLEQEAALILTDSGGVQKEAYFHRTPCVTLRDETEWVETVESGWNQLAGADADAIEAAAGKAAPGEDIPDYGDGHASRKILEILCA